MEIKKLLQNYAKLAIKVGVNLQKGQPLLINAPVHAYEFVQMITEEAYLAGAKSVRINWKDEKINKLFYQNATDETLEEVPSFVIEEHKYYIENNCAVLHVVSENPAIFKDVDPKKLAKAASSISKKLKFYSDHMMASKVQWSIVAYPNINWAKQVFKDLDENEAYEKLMDAILYTSRVTENACEEWEKHIKRLEEVNKKLNDFAFESLHFKNSLGTDLEIGLVEGHIWAGGGEMSGNGVLFAPNIPTEETFTMPHCKKVNGTVVSTKPLNFRGKQVPEFSLTFKDGKVVEYHAKEEEETLKILLETDEGSSYLGEVALISHNSPISNLNVLFFNTLFDENASCHLALGNAYAMNVENGTNMSEEELKKIGYNASTIHVDFMFGSEDLEIIGTTKNKEKVQIFRKGNFVI